METLEKQRLGLRFSDHFHEEEPCQGWQEGYNKLFKSAARPTPMAIHAAPWAGLSIPSELRHYHELVEPVPAHDDTLALRQQRHTRVFHLVESIRLVPRTNSRRPPRPHAHGENLQSILA